MIASQGFWNSRRMLGRTKGSARHLDTEVLDWWMLELSELVKKLLKNVLHATPKGLENIKPTFQLAFTSACINYKNIDKRTDTACSIAGDIEILIFISIIQLSHNR